MLVHFGWYVARLAGGDIVMSYRGNIEIESKDGHYGKHDFEDDIDSKEKAWIILACALCLALAFTCGKLVSLFCIWLLVLNSWSITEFAR